MGRIEVKSNFTVNGKEVSEGNNFNGKDSFDRRRRRNEQIRRNQRIARDLSERFGSIADGSFAYLCGVADKLSEAKIYELYEKSRSPKVRNSWAWFLAMSKRQISSE